MGNALKVDDFIILSEFNAQSGMKLIASNGLLYFQSDWIDLDAMVPEGVEKEAFLSSTRSAFSSNTSSALSVGQGDTLVSISQENDYLIVSWKLAVYNSIKVLDY